MIAHQGGWDEILLVVGPMVVVVLLLRLLKRRVERAVAGPDQETPGTLSIDAPSDDSRPTRSS